MQCRPSARLDPRGNALIIICFMLRSQPDDAIYQPAVAVFALCAVLELVVEPLWILGQMYFYVRLKAS